MTADSVATAAADAAYKTATSDANGQIHFSQLKKGTYYLKELTAPDGYSVNTHVYTVVIDTTYNNDGTLATWSVKIDDKTSTFTLNNEGTWEKVKNETHIVNTTLSSLPSTGGIGTTIFTIVGCGIMIAAAGLFFASRRKENR